MIKNDKKFIIIFIIIVIFCFYYLFQSSYAKYRKKLDGSVQTRIASWLIKVNNENIENKDTLTNEIIPIYDENEYVNDGVIAPGSTGYFELTINAEDVDVDFTYEITTLVDESTPLEDLVLTGYELNGTRHNYEEGSKTVTGDLEKNTGDTNLISEQQTDFIFSAVGEAFGFFGSVIIIGIILLIVLQCIRAGRHARDDVGQMISVGVAALIGYQSFINIGVATRVLPNTGIPLPFISYGLTSLMSSAIGIGIVLNISLQKRKY